MIHPVTRRPGEGMSPFTSDCPPPATPAAASLAAPAAARQGAGILLDLQQCYPFALQITEPMGFWTSACRSVVMRRYDRAYSVDFVGGAL